MTNVGIVAKGRAQGCGIRSALLAISIAAAVICTPSVRAQPKDVLGWEGTRWGMTGDEIDAAFKGRIVRIPVERRQNLVTERAIKSVELAGTQFTVYFQMDERTSQLSQILFFHDFATTAAPPAHLLADLELSLIEKYGVPKLRGPDQQIWDFPSTRIILAAVFSPNRISRSVLIYARKGP
jgi:hypothetical protein